MLDSKRRIRNMAQKAKGYDANYEFLSLLRNHMIKRKNQFSKVVFGSTHIGCGMSSPKQEI